MPHTPMSAVSPKRAKLAEHLLAALAGGEDPVRDPDGLSYRTREAARSRQRMLQHALRDNAAVDVATRVWVDSDGRWRVYAVRSPAGPSSHRASRRLQAASQASG